MNVIGANIKSVKNLNLKQVMTSTQQEFTLNSAERSEQQLCGQEQLAIEREVRGKEPSHSLNGTMVNLITNFYNLSDQKRVLDIRMHNNSKPGASWVTAAEITSGSTPVRNLRLPDKLKTQSYILYSNTNINIYKHIHINPVS